MSLPEFPEFKPISDISEEDLNTHLKSIPPYYDFLYSSLWSWNIDDSYKICSDGQNIIFYMRDPKSQDFFYSIAGTENVEQSARKVFDYLNRDGQKSEINLVPEETAKKLMGTNFKVTESRDDFDYVYETDKLSQLKGKGFKSKRNLINHFKKHNEDYKILHTELTPEIKVEILNFITAENKNRGKMGHIPFADYEMAVLEKFFMLKAHSNILASLIYNKEYLIGFTIDEICDNKWAISHFIKVSIDYKGAFDVLNKTTAQYLQNNGIRFWNWADDIGLEGLRKAKLSYRPIKLLKKFTISE